MALQRRFPLSHQDVFPRGLYLQSERAEAVPDFNAPRRDDGSRPQQVDKDSGLLMWQAVFLDADPEAGKRDAAITVKFLAKQCPVAPNNPTPFPWTPVELVGLTALAYVDDSGNGRPRVAWSYRAEAMAEPKRAPGGVGPGHGARVEKGGGS